MKSGVTLVVIVTAVMVVFIVVRVYAFAITL